MPRYKTWIYSLAASLDRVATQNLFGRLKRSLPSVSSIFCKRNLANYIKEDKRLNGNYSIHFFLVLFYIRSSIIPHRLHQWSFLFANLTPIDPFVLLCHSLSIQSGRGPVLLGSNDRQTLGTSRFHRNRSYLVERHRRALFKNWTTEAEAGIQG